MKRQVMQIMKRFGVMVLSLSLFISLCIPVFAVEAAPKTGYRAGDICDDTVPASNYELALRDNLEIRAEIEYEKNRIYHIIYEQLEEQDALSLLSVYEEILYPQIEHHIMKQYGYERAFTRGYVYAYAPYGGVATYTYNDFGLFDTDVAMTCFNREDTLYNLLNSGSVYAGDLVSFLLGFAPNYGPIFSALAWMRTAISSFSKNSINSAGGYSLIMNTYRHNGEYGTICLGWYEYPYIELPENAYNHNFRIWSEHDPWG